MGKILIIAVQASEVLNKPVPGGSNDFLTLSLKRKPGSSLPPVFPTCAIGMIAIRELLKDYSPMIEEVKVLSPQEGWVKARDSSLTLLCLNLSSLIFEIIQMAN